MRQYLLLPILGLSSLALPAHADILGARFGIEGWRQDSSGGVTETNTQIPDSSLADETKFGAYLTFEHPIPLLPNVRLRYTDFDTDGDVDTTFTIDDIEFTNGANLDIDATALDLTLYYEILDLDVLSLDAGLTIRYLDAEFKAQAFALGSAEESLSAPVPMLYAAGVAGMPFTGLYARAEANYLSYDDSSFSDMQISVGYRVIDNLAVDMSIELGYRKTELDIDDIDDIYADLEFSGAYAGLQLHF